jgi:hypothetical protein
MKLVSKVMSALAVCAGLVGFAGEAHATSYKVIIDCYGNNGSPWWAATNDTITVGIIYSAFFGEFPEEERQTIANIQLASTKCDGNDRISVSTGEFESFDYYQYWYSKIIGVYLSTNGSDGFFVDKIRLANSMGVPFARWGWDDNTGWCLSNDASDVESNCVDGRVYGEVPFYLPTPIGPQ